MAKKGEQKRAGTQDTPQPEAKKQKAEPAMDLIAQLEKLNEQLAAFDPSPFVALIKDRTLPPMINSITNIHLDPDSLEVKRSAGGRLVALLQAVKALSGLLHEPSKRQRATLTQRVASSSMSLLVLSLLLGHCIG